MSLDDQMIGNNALMGMFIRLPRDITMKLSESVVNELPVSMSLVSQTL